MLRIEALESRYPGGVDAFRDSVPNRSFHRDDHLAGVSFLAYGHVKEFGLSVLEASELGGFIQGARQDIVPVDQVDGQPPTCDWLEVEKRPDGYTHCWLRGTEAGELAAPEWWTPEGSRSMRSFLPSEAEEKLQPVSLWYESPQRAAEMAGVQGVIEKDTGQLLYGSWPRPEDRDDGETDASR